MQALNIQGLAPLWRRPAVLRLLLIALLAEIGYAVLNISTMPVYLKFDRHFGASVISLVLVGFLLSEAVMKSPMGHLADKVGRKRLIVIGPALTFGTSLLTLLVPYDIGVWETVILVVLRMLDGVGAAMLWPAAFALVGETVPDGERQQAMSLLNMCYLMGVGLALPIGGIANDLLGSFLAPYTGARSPGLFLSALLFGIVALTAYRTLPSDRDHYAPKEGEDGHGDFKIADVVATARRIPAYLILAVVTFAGIGFPMAIIKIFAEKQFMMSEATFGLLVLPGAGAMAFLSVPMSKFGERIGRAKAVHVGLFLCFIGMAVISAGAFLPFLRAAWVLALGGIPVGLGFLLAIPAWFASVSDVDEKCRGANLGAVMTAQGLGAIIGAPIGGFCYDYFQHVNVDFGRYTPFLGTTFCLLFGWLLSLRILHQPIPCDNA
ncbi:MAG: MFS transporter [Fimbriimonadaceae bacterium]|nr:MFS transporter [Fimbriimonadaceae bacterium]